jgi:hypothetical protein
MLPDYIHLSLLLSDKCLYPYKSARKIIIILIPSLHIIWKDKDSKLNSSKHFQYLNLCSVQY